ncbi:lactonase family protein [Rhodohalobacter sp. SW132]|nr:lactonase family protein [Rhodohalobacter sp. SW132]
MTGYSEQQSSAEIIYIGTFSGQGSEGLYVYEFDRSTEKMMEIQIVSDREGPNFQAIHPDENYLYSVSGQPFSEDTDYGTVSAYEIDEHSGKLTLINEQSVEGRGTAHVSVDPKGRFVYVSNYGEGNLSVFLINDDGSLTEAVDVVHHEGSSVNEQRQNRPHVHSVIPSADGRFIYVPDLGIDKIMIYEVNETTGILTPAETPYAESTPGSGPRHFTIHPNNEFAYSAEELSSTVAVYTIDPSSGALNEIQRVSMLPEGFDESSSAADIHISPDGRFLYASNRGHDSLVIFEIDSSDGELSLVGHESTRGGHPRNFMMDQHGEFVFVANRDNNNVVVFARDKETGKLNYTGEEASVPRAVCVTQFFLR